MSYSRKKLDNAVSLKPLLEYLKILQKKAKDYLESPLFPGIKSIEDYKILGMENTKEHQILRRRTEDFKAFWRARPDILRKSHPNRKKVKK